jgi:hypothetical protein
MNRVEDMVKRAKELGMNIVHGPVGFNDLDREALLVEGFDEMSTFETLYNFPYYQELLEKLGYIKEADWLEYKIFPPKSYDDPLMEKICDLSLSVAKRYKLKVVDEKNKKIFMKQYADGILECINESYKYLYSVIPLSGKVKEQIKKQFMLMINPKYIATVVDEEDHVVGFGLSIPNIAQELNKSRGHLFPLGIFHVLHRLNILKF